MNYTLQQISQLPDKTYINPVFEAVITNVVEKPATEKGQWWDALLVDGAFSLKATFFSNDPTPHINQRCMFSGKGRMVGYYNNQPEIKIYNNATVLPLGNAAGVPPVAPGATQANPVPAPAPAPVAAPAPAPAPTPVPAPSGPHNIDRSIMVGRAINNANGAFNALLAIKPDMAGWTPEQRMAWKWEHMTEDITLEESVLAGNMAPKDEFHAGGEPPF